MDLLGLVPRNSESGGERERERDPACAACHGPMYRPTDLPTSVNSVKIRSWPRMVMLDSEQPFLDLFLPPFHASYSRFFNSCPSKGPICSFYSGKSEHHSLALIGSLSASMPQRHNRFTYRTSLACRTHVGS